MPARDRYRKYTGELVVCGNELNQLLDEYKVYKDEIDVADSERFSYEQMIRVI